MRYVLSLVVVLSALQAKANIAYSQLGSVERQQIQDTLSHYLTADRVALSTALYNFTNDVVEKDKRTDIQMSNFTLQKFASVEALFSQVGQVVRNASTPNLGDFGMYRGRQTMADAMNEVGRADYLQLHIDHGPEDLQKWVAFLDRSIEVRSASGGNDVVVVKGFDRGGLCELVVERHADGSAFAQQACR